MHNLYFNQSLEVPQTGTEDMHQQDVFKMYIKLHYITVKTAHQSVYHHQNILPKYTAVKMNELQLLELN